MLEELNKIDQVMTAKGLNANNNSDIVVVKLPISRIKLDPNNVRDSYDQEEIEKIASSIELYGLINPITVRNDPDVEGGYIITTGHYRYLGHRFLKLEYINSIIKEDKKKLAVQIIENRSRKSMSLVETIKFVNIFYEQELAENPNLTHADLAKMIGEKREWVSRHLQVSNQDPFIQNLVKTERVTDIDATAPLNTLYLKDPEALKEKLEGHEGVISSKLARSWNKPPEAQAPLIEEKSPEAQASLIEKKPEVTENSDNASVENVEQTQAEKPKKPKKNKPLSVEGELYAAFFDGILDSYKAILKLHNESEDIQLSALALNVLRSFDKGQTEVKFTFMDLIKYPELVEEVSSIIQAMAEIKNYVYVSETGLDQIKVLLDQQDLPLKS